MNEKEEEEEHKRRKKNMMLKRKKEGEEEHDDGKTMEGEEKEHVDKKKKKEGVHDDAFHVFLSYRDVKQFEFPSQLYDSLRQEGLVVSHVPMINSFIRTNTKRPPEALCESRIAIIIFSKAYAKSLKCMEELVQIHEFFNREGRFIYTVFYDVDLSEVQNEMEKRFEGKRDQVEKWRRVLSQDATFPSYHFLPKTMSVDECLGKIVQQVIAWMNEKDKYWFWKKEECIGSGVFGIVYKAQHRKTGAICGAVKEPTSDQVNAYEYLQKEIKFLSQLEKHPNIVEYYGHKKEGCHISLYMEYIEPGSLTEYMSRSKQCKLDGHLIQDFTKQILIGLVHLHSNKRVHRDLKPGNLLVDSNNVVKLVDFGLAKKLVEDESELEEYETEHSESGARYYKAPEVRDKIKLWSPHEAHVADIWSLGCVIIEMFSGVQPWFLDPEDRDFGPDSDHPDIPKELWPICKDFVKLCFTKDPFQRPSAATLLEHRFVTGR